MINCLEKAIYCNDTTEALKKNTDNLFVINNIERAIHCKDTTAVLTEALQKNIDILYWTLKQNLNIHHKHLIQ